VLDTERAVEASMAALGERLRTWPPGLTS
jgi:hypothetical protein